MRSVAAGFEDRIASVWKQLRNESISAALLMDPANILYLTGYWTILSVSTPSALVIGLDRPTLIIPGLEYAAAQDLEHSWLDVVVYRNYPLQIGATEEAARGFLETLAQVAKEFAGQPLAVERDTLRAQVRQILKYWSDDALADISGFMRSLRARKDEVELTAIRRAASIAAGAVLEIRRLVQADVREIDLAGHVASHIWGQGARSTHIVIGSGARSALAHPLPSARSLRSGDLVLVDIGVLHEGYWAEIARTFVVGTPNNDQMSWHAIVAAAQAKAANNLTPGISAAEIDNVARSSIAAAGFDGVNFNHALGHGVGLLGMDLPLIAPGSMDTILESCAVTLEPALYFDGRGGIRIEDTYLIAAEGVEPLTDSVSRDLIA